MSLKYSGKILFTNSFDVDRRTHPTYHLQSLFLGISNFKAIHILRLLNMSSQELLLPFLIFLITHVSDMP